MRNFIHYPQLDARDCGPTCLRMVAKHYGKNYSLQRLREKSFITREGVSLLGISEAAEQIGFRSIGVSMSWEQLTAEAPLPCIVHCVSFPELWPFKIRVTNKTRNFKQLKPYEKDTIY
ncbi:MAG: Lactococcin-G-processing and transport ATP-binding protein LagD [Bacteroidetes bacterium ADurb.Bin012]|jgi:ATP-binding cassette subfamily B protein|nr:MAG: Lactococcin-G-processing and transport ATP-binding protein LagD [Bacteroidetes bacterium ADurb.Bin012]